MTARLASPAAGTAGRGRPRSAEADRAIVEAALAVLADEGAAGFSMEAVATRAGVGKSTVYRRFSGAHELLARALGTLNDDLPAIPDSGSTRDTLVEMLEAFRLRPDDARSARCMPQVMSQAHRDPQLFETYWDRVVAARRQRFREVIERGMARGEVREGLDVDMLVSLVTGPMLAIMSMTPASRRRVDGDTSRQIIDAIFEGIAPTR